MSIRARILRFRIGREGSTDKLIVRILRSPSRTALYVSVRIPFTTKRFRHVFNG